MIFGPRRRETEVRTKYRVALCLLELRCSASGSSSLRSPPPRGLLGQGHEAAAEAHDVAAGGFHGRGHGGDSRYRCERGRGGGSGGGKLIVRGRNIFTGLPEAGKRTARLLLRTVTLKRA